MPLNLTPSDSAKDLIKDGWFGEKEAMWPGQKFCIEVEEVLCNGRSQFQVNIFKYSNSQIFLSKLVYYS